MAKTSAAPTTKPAICRLNHISVRGTDYGREIGAGEPVDLLERDAAGVTLEELLGHHVAAFELTGRGSNANTLTPAAPVQEK